MGSWKLPQSLGERWETSICQHITGDTHAHTHSNLLINIKLWTKASNTCLVEAQCGASWGTNENKLSERLLLAGVVTFRFPFICSLTC